MTNSLQLIIVLLAVAVGVVVACRLLHLPVVLGYLTVGILIGPHALGWIPDTPGARHLAEFGLVFLMFSIGLEFSLARLHKMKRTVFGLGGAQVAITLLLVMVAMWLAGFDWRASLAIGCVLAMSSTAIVSKMLVERAEMSALHGQQIIGVLLFQDLSVVPFLIIIPALASAPGSLSLTLVIALLKAVSVLVILLVFGQRMMSSWFHVVARQNSPELFMLNVLFITLGLAYLTELVGLSMALGAFVAGILIAETEYRYQVADDIKPFRDVLMGLFFVTVGMMVDLSEMFANIGQVLLMLLCLLLIKLTIVALLVHKFTGNWGVAIRSGLGLAQAGEFGVVLLALAGGAHLLSPATMQSLLDVMLLSMLIAPFLIQYAEVIVRRALPSEWMSRAMRVHQIAVQSMAADANIIICGYGRSGQALARFMKHENIRFIVLDLDSRRVHEAAAAGESVVYGDAAKREVLLAAGLMSAKTLVVTYSDKHSALKILHVVSELRPELPVVVLTTDETNIEALKQAGAAEVVAEVVEGSVMLASQALLMSGVPLNRVVRRLQENRARRYSMFGSYFRATAGVIGEVTENLQPRFHSVLVGERDVAAGKTLDQINLAALGVEVHAVRRHNMRGNQPVGEMKVRVGDVLVLLGQPMSLTAAKKYLRDGQA